jgi:hypothetical protein
MQDDGNTGSACWLQHTTQLPILHQSMEWWRPAGLGRSSEPHLHSLSGGMSVSATMMGTGKPATWAMTMATLASEALHAFEL